MAVCKRNWIRRAVRNALVVSVVAGLVACGGSGSSDPTTTPSAGVIGFGAANTYTIDEGVGVASFTLTRSGGSSGAVSVTCATADGTAVAGSDFTATNVTVSWADGDTADKTCDVTVTEDSDIELDEDLSLTLSGDTLSTAVTRTITITDNDSVTITGVVSAPNGSLAFNGPTLLQRMLAAVFGKSAQAGLSDVVSPVAGATVEVFRVNANGDTVDASGNPTATPIATGTTDGNGTFTLPAPLDAPASQYIVRATGSTGTLDSRISAASMAVDPATDAVSDLIVGKDLAAITVAEVQEIEEAVAELITNIDTTVANTANALATALQTEASNDEETSNVINSTASGGQICGTVTDSGGNALANIRIVARDFDNLITRARTRTGADGSYCLNVPVAGDADAFSGGTFNGRYVVGAINRTDDSNDPGRHASEWWSTGGAAYHRYEAEMIVVSDTTPVTGKDFQLEPGARVTGSVTGGGMPVEGAKVVIRDFDNRTPIASARAAADGSYSVNVIPGRKMLVTVTNSTLRPYASEIHDGATGVGSRNKGLPIQLAAGEARTIDFDLEQGYLLEGTITDGDGTTPVPGMRVRIDKDSGPVDRLRTDKQGYYRIWLRSYASYSVSAYGQNATVDLSASNVVQDFNATVSRISGVLQDSAGNPVSQAKVRLYAYDASGVKTYKGFEISKSDGSVTLYSDYVGDHRVLVKLDRVVTRDDGAGGTVIVGSSVFNNRTELANGDIISITTAGQTIDATATPVTLPDGGVLMGTIYAGSSGDTSTPIAAFSLDVRDAPDGSAANTATSFVGTRSRGDGSYVLTLPAGTYERVKMKGATVGNGNCDNITITAGQTTTLNYYDGDNTCEVL